MRHFALAVLLVLGGAAGAAAQGPSGSGGLGPTAADVLCAGMMTKDDVPYDTYVISGEEADPRTIFALGDYIYINKGASQGAKVGDMFMVMRPETDFLHIPWYADEHFQAGQAGTIWRDVARIKVVVTHPAVSIAQITYGCTYLQRGDYVLPAVDYPSPPFRALKDFDRFAPPSGKSQGRVVRAKGFQNLLDRSAVAYVTLPDAKVGDYIRFYRPTGEKNKPIYQVGGMSDHVLGFGSTPQRYHPQDLPREVIGEGVVLRVTKTTVSVLIYNELREVYIGDQAEIE